MHKVAIIGGTGTLGKELVRQLYQKALITIVSRDELKQQNMKKEYPDCKYIIGDIRDRQALERVFMAGSFDTVFLTAALKHVDVIEHNPLEGIKTNIIGAVNCAEMAQRYMVKNFIFSTTDKAVNPINVYGMTKGIAERYLLSLNEDHTYTKFRCFRWGNVTGSRGAAIHHFVKSLKEKQSANITDKKMTRFWIRIEDAVKYMLDTYESANLSQVVFPDMAAAKIVDVIDVLAELLGVDEYTLREVGIRPGEKIHECMYTSHDFCINSENCRQYTRPELKNLLREFV